MIIVGMSVVATVVVLQYHHHDPNGGNMPKWVSPPNGSSQLRPRPSLTCVSSRFLPALLHLLCYLGHTLPAACFQMKESLRLPRL